MNVASNTQPAPTMSDHSHARGAMTPSIGQSAQAAADMERPISNGAHTGPTQMAGMRKSTSGSKIDAGQPSRICSPA